MQKFPISEISLDSLQILHSSKGISGILGLQHMMTLSRLPNGYAGYPTVTLVDWLAMLLVTGTRPDDFGFFHSNDI